MLKALSLAAALALSSQPDAPTTPGADPAPREAKPAQDAFARDICDDTPRVIASGLGMAEGPSWMGDRWVIADMSQNAILTLGQAPGAKPEVLHQNAGKPTGTAIDSQGRILTARWDGSIARHEKDGTVTTLAARFEGKRLNSPNDLALRKDGMIFFTDPTFGIDVEDRQLEFRGVFALDPAAKPESALRAVARDFIMPNGLCLSPDEKRLYVADYGRNHIRVFDVAPDGSLANGRVFADVSVGQGMGRADGLKCDSRGNLYATGKGGVHVFSPDGQSLGVIRIDWASNLAFGGSDGRTLLITERSRIWSVKVKIPGPGFAAN